MSPRRFRALILGLSTDSALYRSMHPETWHWNTQMELTAIIAELIDRLDIHFVMANRDPKKSGGMLKPIEIPRPWKRERKKGTTMAELIAMVQKDREEVTNG